MPKATDYIKRYFDQINKAVDIEYEIANKARAQGIDPEKKVDIPLAVTMAERVEGLISVVAPQLVGSGFRRRIEELEKKYSPLAWEVALIIAGEVAKQKFCKFKDVKEAMEIGVRVGFTYNTLGIVAAPLEGFVELQIKKRHDGGEYVAAYYAGPIRGAGGTAAAFSTIIVDYVRTKLGYKPYDPTPEEVRRFISEIHDYNERITNLQYMPSDDELEFLAKHLPIEVNGDPTEKLDVSNYKDQPRVETNKIRGGMCLVMAEGLAQKAPKLWKRLEKWGKDLGLEWGFLADFLVLQKKKKSGSIVKEKAQKITPNFTFITDIVAGRPVLTPPLGKGGFRLRYGRSRLSGFSAASIHPFTQYVLDRFIAIGTQLKVERPGKACAITSCDTIEPPIVKLTNGNVVRITNKTDVKNLVKDIDEILFLGDILFNYGDFSENGAMLAPPGYCPEWWVQELEKATVDLFGVLDTEKLEDLVSIGSAELKNFLNKPMVYFPSYEQAKSLAVKLSMPMHPKYTHFWSLLSNTDIVHLIKILSRAKVEPEKMIISNLEVKPILERIGMPHVYASSEYIVVTGNDATALVDIFGPDFTEKAARLEEKNKKATTDSKTADPDIEKPLDSINSISDYKIRDLAGTFIGARMGRPEKAKMRVLTGKPHVLFPVGDQGGRLRSFQAALLEKKIKAEFPTYMCAKCQIETIGPICHKCNTVTVKKYFCIQCGLIDQPDCPGHGEARPFRRKEIDIKSLFDSAVAKSGLKVYPDLIKGVRGTANKDHIPEDLLKGILRAKYDVYVNKDGTTRYDMSELPITHFRPIEIGASIEKLIELGYEKDIHGKPLEDKKQVLEILPQDIIIPSSNETMDESADRVMINVALFVDDLLQQGYGMPPFYNIKTREDLIGQYVIGLAPHISAGMIGRIIGFSETQGCLAHPYWHAALRRDCDGDECSIMLLLDSLLNFSRQYLPDRRGSRTMDAPLVLTSILNPSEVDDMVHGMDIVSKYPLEFYESALKCKFPWEIKISQINSKLNTDTQYEGVGYTHETTNFNRGVRVSAYKFLPSMREKLEGQMRLAERIRAVNATDVARLVIEKHFLKDIRGNLKKFSMQQFRCVKCNEKFRRPPLTGICHVCGGKIIFTISEGSIIKYLQPSLDLGEKYNISNYLKQTLELTRRGVEGVFGKEPEIQEGLGKWF
ncbi:DNA polymerase II large subunit [Candidatus Woesearchaeota archaeon]|nr:DNA polymerase II large subunit [Candidatus Woesearchaeota archaeon]